MKTKTYHAYSTESRAVLVLLGFGGVLDFAKKAGIHHETAGMLLGTNRCTMRKRHYTLLQAHETLHSAYLVRRPVLTYAARMFVQDWAKRWQKVAADEFLLGQSFGKMKEGVAPQWERQRDQRQKQVKASFLVELQALEWK